MNRTEFVIATAIIIAACSPASSTLFMIAPEGFRADGAEPRSLGLVFTDAALCVDQHAEQQRALLVAQPRLHDQPAELDLLARVLLACVR